MNRATLLAFGIQLAVRTDRAGRLRFVLISGAVAVGLALMLGVLSVLPARVAIADREARRTPAASEPAPAAGAAVHLVSGPWRGRTVTTVYVAVGGPVRELPPGVSRLPRPGEVAASPALRAALAEHPAELRARVPGRVTGVVGDDGLLGPRELFAWVGVQRSELPPASPTVQRFGVAGPGQLYVSDDLRVALAVAFVGLLVPILAFLATVSRLSAAARDRRLAVLRLVGASARETRWLAAAETGAAAAAGVLGGLGLFLAVRGPAAGVMASADGVFAADVAPPPWVTVAIAFAVPVLTIGVSILALHGVVTTPLGVARRAAPRPAGWWRLVPLGVGLVLLLGAWLDRRGLLAGEARGSVLLVGGAGLTLVGLAVAAAAVSRLGASVLLRTGSLPANFAGRRIAADPGASARTMTGAVLVVAVVAWLLGFLPLLEAARGGSYAAVEQRSLQPGTLIARLDGAGPLRDDPVALASAVPGVEHVAGIGEVGLSLRAGGDRQGVLVGDCADVSAALRKPLPGCRADTAYRLVHPYDRADLLAPGQRVFVSPTGGTTPPTEIRLPDQLPAMRIGDRLSALQTEGALLLPPRLVPSGYRSPSQLLIVTDGRGNTRERVRSALWRIGSFDVPMTPAERARYFGTEAQTVAQFSRAAVLGALLALAVAGLSVAVTTADSVRERRLALAGLSALGVPTRLLRRSVLLQVAAPLVLNVTVALAAGIVGCVLYLNLDSAAGGPPVPLPWVGWAGLAAGTVAAVVLATALTLPFIRGAVQPEALRTE